MWADRAFIFRFDGELLRVAATFNASGELKEFIEQNPIRLDRHSTRHLNAERSTFLMFSLIQNIRMGRRMLSRSALFSPCRYSKVMTCLASY